MSHTDVFNSIYRTNAWGKGSGSGSTEENTRQYRIWLEAFMRHNRICSVTDVGCGDWQFSQHIDWQGVRYIGVDVSSIVMENTQRYSRSGIEFKVLDATKTPLPEADLLIAKDVLQHWSNSDVQSFIPQLTLFRYALITNGHCITQDPRTNTDIPAGSWRPIDVSRPPFNLSGAYVAWFDADEPKHTFLWVNPIFQVSYKTENIPASAGAR
jgi:SAM-dependent methyltransferase